jgi:hypothetical protein
LPLQIGNEGGFMLQTKTRWAVLIVASLLIGPIMVFALAGPTDDTKTEPGDKQTYLDKSGDEELAYLLVKLEKKTRQVIAGHYGRQQPGGPDATATYKEYLIQNLILPAAVADPIFSEVVPKATGGRAWVKMVVPEPRNPNNQGDATALAMLAALRNGGDAVWRTNAGAHYYAEPIVAKAGCLPCHGTPAGEPDEHFPQYRKNGWKAGEVIGAVVARVAPEE